MKILGIVLLAGGAALFLFILNKQEVTKAGNQTITLGNLGSEIAASDGDVTIGDYAIDNSKTDVYNLPR